MVSMRMLYGRRRLPNGQCHSIMKSGSRSIYEASMHGARAASPPRARKGVFYLYLQCFAFGGGETPKMFYECFVITVLRNLRCHDIGPPQNALIRICRHSDHATCTIIDRVVQTRENILKL
jgi:hypothetical protein